MACRIEESWIHQLPCALQGYFYAQLTLGVPAAVFAVIVDTGSTITYVPCASCGGACGPHHQVCVDVRVYVLPAASTHPYLRPGPRHALAGVVFRLEAKCPEP